MIVSLDNDYRSDLLFLPARNGSGELAGLEVIATFSADRADVRFPVELLTHHLSSEQELCLFREKLELLATCQIFFIQQHLLAWIAITPVIVDALLTDAEFASLIERFPFLELTLNENYPGLDSLTETHPLVALSKRYPLVLANFGAGDTNMNAVFSGLFKRVALDKNFVQRQLSGIAFEPFMRALFAQISPFCESVMIAGIDSEEMRQHATAFPFSAMQGALWPMVNKAQVTSLVQ
ncbi:EAL domain-containing protein [Superficieibacter electus]|uniref:EAL domain-containing protein n=1 Tax=Superficieibacter electus TaxID=2022662 RepID=A0A2P5GU62_9ENTR|nr:EAL domain-containing protein [Superficieibacter electus]POP47240.1 EAL domain-containing protein [Superficieibacter electus]POP50086.1 EAL domain-containing protein [Superficieibacter electus]